MSEINLKPAINLQEVAPVEISAEEFQRKLYNWFEERGLVSELRTHLRTQMVNVLKGTSIGQTVTSKPCSSPKLQAINLIVAEFLLRQNYHYSLSVFTSEVPLTNLLPEISNSIVHSSKPKAWHFQPKETWDILETIGLLRSSSEGNLIFDLYYEKCIEETLLSCIIQGLRNLNYNNDNKDLEKNAYGDFNPKQTWVKDIYSILVWARISEPQLTNICHNLQQIVEDKIRKFQEEKEAEVQDKKHDLENQFTKKSKENQQKFEDACQLMIKECQAKHDRIEELGNTLKNHQIELNLRSNNLLQREQLILEKQEEYNKKEKELSKREENVRIQLEKLNEQKLETQRLKEDLLRNENKIEIDLNLLAKLKEECSKLKSELHSSRSLHKSVANQTLNVGFNDNTETDISVHNQLQRLQIENAKLKQINEEQDNKILELNLKITQLSEETLENPKVKKDINNTPILKNNLIEETNSNMKESSQHKHINVRDAFKYKGSKQTSRKFHREIKNQRPSSSSSLEEQSPTEDILHDARERLKKLEEESEMVDNLYKQFQDKYKRNIFNSTSLLLLQENKNENITHYPSNKEHSFYNLRSTKSNDRIKNRNKLSHTSSHSTFGYTKINPHGFEEQIDIFDESVSSLNTTDTE